MRLRVSDPQLSPDLLRFLQRRVDVVGAEVDDGELEISLLGSRRAPHLRRELDARVRMWCETHPDIEVDFLD